MSCKTQCRVPQSIYGKISTFSFFSIYNLLSEKEVVMIISAIVRYIDLLESCERLALLNYWYVL